MRTRSSVQQLQVAERKSQKCEEDKKENESSAGLSDEYIDSLVDFAVSHMKKAQLKESEKKQDEKESSFLEDFLPLDSVKETFDPPSRQVESMLRVSSVAHEERIPQGLDSGFDLELKESKSEKPNKEKDIRKMLVKSSQDKLLAKSVLRPHLEKQHNIQPYSNSKRSQKKARKKLRDAKAGDEWYNMKAVEMTTELQNDLKAIQMRSVLDPKRFYRKNDMKTLPKYFQVGTIMDSSVDFFHARVSKKERRQTIVEELLADAETRRYNKRKYMELQIHRSFSKRRRRMMNKIK